MKRQCPGPLPTEGLTRLEDAPYSTSDLAVLTIARHYFHTFAVPEQHGWNQAICGALFAFGHDRGPEIAIGVLSVVQSMRRARKSCFRFNSADCPTCSQYVSGHERALMSALRCVAAGRRDAARAHVFLLCEGSVPDCMMQSLAVLVELVSPRSSVKRRMQWGAAQDTEPASEA